MFHFAGFAPHTYGFSVQYPTMTSDGLPHSEISGSKVACHLPGAYRRLLRPSSPAGVEASTVCLYRRVSIYILNLGEHCILVFSLFCQRSFPFLLHMGKKHFLPHLNQKSRETKNRLFQAAALINSASASTAWMYMFALILRRKILHEMKKWLR